MRQVRVMVTGVGGGGHGEQILKALKMSDTPYFIVGGDMNPYSKGLLLVDVPVILPPAHSVDYMDAVLSVCRKNRVEALFHGSEPELKVFSQNRERIRGEGIFLPINPSAVIDRCMDKYASTLWLAENGFVVPKSCFVSQVSDLQRIDFLPAVLKPSIGGGGSNNTFIAQTPEELQAYGEILLQYIQNGFIVQEYVGTVDSEFTVGILSDMEGNFINSIAVKRMIMSGLSNRIKIKNRTARRELGEVLAISSGVSQGEIGRFPEVTGICEVAAKKMGSTGAINVQCRLFEGKVYFFEINPRFSGTTSLRAMVGYNEPDVLIRKHLLGESILNRFPYREGIILRGLEESFMEKGRI